MKSVALGLSTLLALCVAWVVFVVACSTDFKKAYSKGGDSDAGLSVAPAKMAPQDYCATLTKELEVVVVDVQKKMVEELGPRSSLQIWQTRCEKKTLVAELIFAAVFDEEYQESVMVMKLVYGDDGKIQGQILGFRPVEE